MRMKKARLASINSTSSARLLDARAVWFLGAVSFGAGSRKMRVWRTSVSSGPSGASLVFTLYVEGRELLVMFQVNYFSYVTYNFVSVRVFETCWHETRQVNLA